MTIKRMIFWAHLGTGLVAGLLVLWMSVTGLLLTYERGIVGAVRTAAVEAAAGAVPQTIDELAAAAFAAGAAPGNILTISADRQDPVEVAAGRRLALLLDPYTAQPMTDPAAGIVGFFDHVTALHRWLVLAGSGPGTGAEILAAANLALLFLLVSGAYLWLPRLWTWRALRARLVLRRGLTQAPARHYNWHHVFGAWALVPLVAIVLSGVVMSYPWANQALFALYGETAPAGREGGGSQGAAPAGDSAATAAAPSLPLETIVATATAGIADWRKASLALPAPGAAAAEVRVDAGNGAQPARVTTFRVSLAEGAILEQRAAAASSPGAQARGFLRFLHTGEVFGLLGQTIAGLACIAAVMLVYTGLSLGIRRLFRLSAVSRSA